MPYTVVDADELEPGFTGPSARPARLSAFGIDQADLAPEAEGREHDRAAAGQEDAYLVLRGSGRMTVDADEVERRPGRYVFVAAGSRGVPVAGPDGLSFVAAGARPQDGWAAGLLAHRLRPATPASRGRGRRAAPAPRR